MTGVIPHRPPQRRVARREGAGRALAVHLDLAPIGMKLALNQVVADLVDQLQGRAEHLGEGRGDLLGDHQAVDDGEVPPRRDGIEVVAAVGRVGGEVAIVEGPEVGTVSEAAAARVHLDEEGLGPNAALQLDEVVAAPE